MHHRRLQFGGPISGDGDAIPSSGIGAAATSQESDAAAIRSWTASADEPAAAIRSWTASADEVPGSSDSSLGREVHSPFMVEGSSSAVMPLGMGMRTPRELEVEAKAGTSGRIMLTPLPAAAAEEINTPGVERTYTHKEDMRPEFIPRPGMRFKSEKEAKGFFLRYAAQAGFGINMGNKKTYSRIMRCSCEGRWEYFKKGSGSPRVRNDTSSKTGCMVRIKLNFEYDKYRNLDAAVIEYANLVHNHPLLSPKSAKNHRSHKVKDKVFFEYVDELQGCNVPPESMNNLIREMHGGVENVPITSRDLQNRKAANVRAENANDINKLLQFFEDCHSQNTRFRWATKLDSNGEIHSLFWSSASMQGEYADFGDVMTFDTTHKTNLYDKPLAIFMGANHHLQNTIFGCALLGDETNATFEWVFQAFKKCMGTNRTSRGPRELLFVGNIVHAFTLNNVWQSVDCLP